MHLHVDAATPLTNKELLQGVPGRVVRGKVRFPPRKQCSTEEHITLPGGEYPAGCGGMNGELSKHWGIPLYVLSMPFHKQGSD